MSTKTANLELIKPELADPADITAFNANWDIIDGELHRVMIDSSSKSIVVEDTIEANRWSTNLYTWQSNNITSVEQIIELLPSTEINVEQLEALQSANIVGVGQEVGNVTFKAYGDIPTINIPVIFVIRGDV